MNRLFRFGLLALPLLLTAAPASAQTVTGLSRWSLYIDPGHSENENVGVYGYSEARKVLRVGLFLRDMLRTRTDIGAVYMSRTDDLQQVGLSQRSDDANARGAAFFHSIHSNAGPPGTNNTLMLYGGWRAGGVTVEKTPVGGGRMGDRYIEVLTRAMRIPTIGNFADRSFYEGAVDHANRFPYLSVNRQSAMASVLSEAGFHTNPRQNTLNMNAEWKKLEAQAFYWAILDWHGVARSTHRIATGIVTDGESGRPVNGATVTLSGKTYTTDTYQSLFRFYSTDPNELANGFYYLEDIGAGAQTVTVTAPGFRSFTGTVNVVDTEFSFFDAALVSTVAPTVAQSTPAPGANPFPVTSPVRVTFSRPMDAATTTAAFSVAPTSGGASVAGAVTFESNNTVLVFTPAAPLAAQTAFTLRIAGTATTRTGDALDGNRDGTPGDAYSSTFTTGFPDAAAPRLRASFPAPNSTGAALLPVISVAFDEPVDPATLDGRVTLEVQATGARVAGRFRHDLAAVVGATPTPRSTVSFVPDAPLTADVLYRFAIEPGVRDRFLNETTGRYTVSFRTGTTDFTVTPVETFEGTAVADNWWVPQQSGSTTGIVTDSTSRTASPRANLLGGTTAMRIDYGWDGSGSPLIRQYLIPTRPPYTVSFSAPALLQAYVFGDGNGTLFRFAVDDSAPSTEVSPWVAVDWIGWRPVTWDLATDGTGSWIGNGTLDGALRFDSFQLSRTGDTPRFGELVVDDLRVLRRVSVAGEAPAGSDAPLVALAPRPNPTRGDATVAFRIASEQTVTVRVFNAIGQQVAVLADNKAFAAGEHALRFDGARLAAGVYVVRIEAGVEVATVRLVIAR